MVAIPNDRLLRIVVVALAVACVTGCCPGKAGHDQEGEVASAGSSKSALIKGFVQAKEAGVQLQANPLSLDLCTSNGRPVEITWDVTQAKLSKVKVLVKGGDRDTKLWAEGGAVGRQLTGDWVFPGTEFTLADEQDKPLALLVIGSTSCNK